MSTDITQTEIGAETKVAKGGGCCGPAISTRAVDESPRISEISSRQDWMSFVRYWLRDRRVLILLGLAVLVGGAWLSWGWLAAIGVAPVLLAIAPCGIMCALGLCSMGRGKGNPASGANAPSSGDGSLPVSQLTSRQNVGDQE